MIRRMKFLAVLAFTMACTGPESPSFDLIADNGPGLYPGVIKYYTTPVSVELPETAIVGQPFVVKVATHGDGCFSKGEVTVSQSSAASVVVEPFDEVLGRGPREPGELRFCNQNGRTFFHIATVQFDQAGLATVTVRGWALPEDEPLEAKYTVFVR